MTDTTKALGQSLFAPKADTGTNASTGFKAVADAAAVANWNEGFADLFDIALEQENERRSTQDVTLATNGRLGNFMRGAYSNAQSKEELKSWQMADIVSDITGVSARYAKDNMDGIVKAYTGRDIDTSNFVTGLGKSFVSRVVSDYASVRARMFNAKIRGMDERSRQLAIDDFTSNMLPQMSYYWNADMYGYKDNVLGKVAYFTFENLPSVLESQLLGAFAGMLGGAVTVGKNVIDLLYNMTRVASVFEKESGSSLLGMWQTYNSDGRRMSYDAMSNASTQIGLVNTIFEFGLEKALGALGVATSERWGRNVKEMFSKFTSKSSKEVLDAAMESTGRYIANGLAQNARSAVGEGFTEAMQTWSEDFFTNLAYRQSKGFGDYVKSNGDILKDMAETFVYTAASTFLEAPFMIGAEQDAFSLLNYARDSRTGRVVNLNKASQYSTKTDTSTLVRTSTIDVAEGTEPYKGGDTANARVYKVGDSYIPATKEDAQRIAKAKEGGTHALYVETIGDSQVEGSPMDFTASVADQSYAIGRNARVAGDSVVVSDGEQYQAVRDVMKSDGFVSAEFYRDGEVVSDGSFDRARLSIVGRDGELRTMDIVTDSYAQANGIEAVALEDTDAAIDERRRQAWEKVKDEELNRRIKESASLTQRQIDERFAAYTLHLSTDDRKYAERFRKSLVKQLGDVYADRRTVKSVASISASLVSDFAAINHMSVKDYVETRLGSDRRFIKVMTAKQAGEVGTSAFIERGSDGTWTVNLYNTPNRQTDIVHEFSHMFLSTLEDESVIDEFKSLYKAEYDEGGVLGRAFQERFATDLENYVVSGRARSQGLKAVFETIVRAMDNFKNLIKGIDFDNKADVLEAFDRLFSDERMRDMERRSTTYSTLETIASDIESARASLDGLDAELAESIRTDMDNAQNLISQMQELEDRDRDDAWRELYGELYMLDGDIAEALKATKDEALARLASDVSEDSLYNLMNGRPYSELSYRDSSKSLGNIHETDDLIDNRLGFEDSPISYRKENSGLSDLQNDDSYEVDDELKGILEEYTSGKYEFICNYAQGIVENNDMLKQRALKYMIPTLEDPVEKIHATELILNAINSQPFRDQDLYRIEKTHWYDKFGGYKEGDIVTWGIRSVSRDPSFTEKVIKGLDEGIRPTNGYGRYYDFITYTIKGKTKSLDISQYSTFDQSENIVSGRFKVESVKENRYYEDFENRQKDIISKAASYMDDPISAFDELGIKYRRFISKKGNDTIEIEGFTEIEGLTIPFNFKGFTIPSGILKTSNKIRTLFEDRLGIDKYGFKGIGSIVEIELSALDEAQQAYGKNVGFMRSAASTLVPYTTEQTVGRIKVGRPVDSADIRTLLATDTSMTAYQRSVLEKELNAQAVLTSDPILRQVILDSYSKTKDFAKAYDATMETMKSLDPSFSFKTSEDGLSLIRRAVAHSRFGTTDSLNADFLAKYSGDHKELGSLAKSLKARGYLDRELANLPLSALERIAEYSKRGAKISDSTYERAYAEIADPAVTTMVRRAADYGTSYEDVGGVYYPSDVSVDAESVSLSMYDQSLPEGYRQAVRESAYEGDLMGGLDSYARNAQADYEKAMQDYRQARMDMGRAKAGITELKKALERVREDYKAQRMDAARYERLSNDLQKRLDMANRRYENHVAMERLRSLRAKIARLSVLDRNKEDHTTGRDLQLLHSDITHSEQELKSAKVEGSPLKMVSKVSQYYPALSRWLVSKGIVSEDGMILNNIGSLSFEDTQKLYDLVKRYRDMSEERLSIRKAEAKADAKSKALEMRSDMAIDGRWTLDEEQTMAVEQRVDEEVLAMRESGEIETIEDEEYVRDTLMQGRLAEARLGEAKKASRPGNVQYGDSQKVGLVKNMRYSFDIPRNILRSFGGNIELTVMGGYDANGVEHIGAEQLTTEKARNVQRRMDGFKDAVLATFGDYVRKKGEVSKWDMVNIFSKDTRTLDGYKAPLFEKTSDMDGMVYTAGPEVSEYMKSSDPMVSRVAKQLYDLAVAQDKAKWSNGDETFEYTLNAEMAAYLLMRQKDSLNSLWHGNNLSASQLFRIFTDFVDAEEDSRYGRARRLADYMQADAESRFPVINGISIELDNKDMEEVRVLDYFGLLFDNSPTYDALKITLDPQSLDSDRNYMLSEGFLQDRTGSAKALSLDLMGSWERQVDRQEHYIAFARYFDSMRRIMVDEHVFDDIKRQNGDDAGRWLNSFFRGLSNAGRMTDDVGGIVTGSFGWMRSNLAKAALAYNPTPVLTQPATLAYAIAEGIPVSYMLSSMKSNILDTKATEARIYSLSPQMRSQSRLEVDIAKSTSRMDYTSKRSRAQMYIDIAAEWGMKPMEYMDNMVKNTLWLAKYNLSLDSYTKAKMDREYASKRAAYDADVFVLDSQTNNLAKNNPEAYRTKNDLVRSILMFTSQSNKQYWYFRDNVTNAEKGRRLKVFASSVLGASMAIALTCLARGKLIPKKDEDFDEWIARATKDVAAEALANTPLVGSLVQQVGSGWSASGQLLIADVINDFYSLGTEILEPQSRRSTKTKGEKIATDLKNLSMDAVGMAGLPEQAMKKLYNALASGNVLKALGYDWGELLED